jgi:hypothetical protein
VDWKDEKKPRTVAVPYAKDRFRFTAPGQQSLRIVLDGPPLGQGKLLLPRSGLHVELPFAADRVAAHVARAGSPPVTMAALDTAGTLLGLAKTDPHGGPVQALEVTGTGITTLVFQGGAGEALLVDLCAYRRARAHG